MNGWFQDKSDKTKVDANHKTFDRDNPFSSVVKDLEDFVEIKIEYDSEKVSKKED